MSEHRSEERARSGAIDGQSEHRSEERARSGAIDSQLDWLVSDALAPSADPGDSLSELYGAAARGALALPFCANCNLALELEQRVCDGCQHTAVQWRQVESCGVVHAVTMVHRREPGLILFDGPYPVLDVEVASGHRLIMTTAAPVEIAPRIGQRITIVFRRVGSVSLPAAEIVDSLEPDPIASAPIDLEVHL